MLKSVRHAWCLLLLLPLLSLNLQAEEYEEGVHYQKISKPVRTQDASKVEVVELFGYWCPHCNNFERHLEPWKKKMDAQSYFKHIPVVFRPNQAEFAKAYYVAKSLGVEKKAHGALFNLIHRQRQWINTDEELAKFFAGLGVSQSDFDKAYKSFALNSQMSSGKKKARAYEITGVPAMVVNGKYRVSADMAGSQRNMLKVVDFLISKEKELL
ncbi:MAG: thiol:disulfide interchange protein DsbA/DsbL [Motiliproteus sp.]|nr:thiol:disulfide interchange protein DsbA/DsbL [Motiliproteus sp.]MCW9051437.1 thiol:disulfide interchange protein DsbA/DsbL [Motiliproteus sp.]